MATETTLDAPATRGAPRAVTINGERRSIEAQTLDDVVAALDYDAEAVATALDGVFVPRARRSETPVTDGAKIEIVAPRQGG